MKIDNYLYEIIYDYQNADSEEERKDIFHSFCTFIWTSENKRRVYTKTIRYTVRKDLSDTDIGQVFETWSSVEYKGYKSMSGKTDWCSLIRQKINNLYTRYFDKEVIVKSDYIDLLKTPKRLYYQWINGLETDAGELTAIIDDAIDNAEKLKNTYQKQKINLAWNDYKKIIEGFLLKIFSNCKMIEDYEDQSQLSHIYDFINEDNFYISYFCKSLEGEMKKWQKQYYNIREHKNYRRCMICGRLIEKTNNRILYCKDCAAAVNREKSRNNIRKKRMFDLEKS